LDIAAVYPIVSSMVTEAGEYSSLEERIQPASAGYFASISVL